MINVNLSPTISLFWLFEHDHTFLNLESRQPQRSNNFPLLD